MIAIIVLTIVVTLKLKDRTQNVNVDGIWTGHDWQNYNSGVAVANGIPYGLNSKVI